MSFIADTVFLAVPLIEYYNLGISVSDNNRLIAPEISFFLMDATCDN